jgi:hypothetical protein
MIQSGQEESLIPRETEESYILNPSVSILLNLWRSEVHAPELLQFQSELIDEIKGQLTKQQVIIKLNYHRFENVLVFSERSIS